MTSPTNLPVPISSNGDMFRVPEDKCHMVLPEIEEEEEDEGQKLSLTSLLLGIYDPPLPRNFYTPVGVCIDLSNAWFLAQITISGFHLIRLFSNI